MIITYFRSSSFNGYDLCPRSYFSDYVLGRSGPGGLAADKGTIVHKILETMAVAKKGKQEKKKSITDDICGVVPTKEYDINKLVECVYGYYSKHLTHHDWTEKDYKDCKDWTWQALQYNDGQFDPRNRTIVAAEPYFDIEIQEPWAMYDYEIDGKRAQGFLSLKGTIDLVTKVGPKAYEIVDYKSGGYRKNWATGKTKELEDFYHDPQLRMYHYAVHKMYDVDTVVATIFYIRAGGPFTVCLDKDELPKTEEMIRKQFEKIKADVNPQMCPSDQRWKCRKFCHQGQSTFEGTDIVPIQEFRRGYPTRYGETMTKCEQIAFEISRKGEKKVMQEYTAKGHSVAFYKDPGSVE